MLDLSLVRETKYHYYFLFSLWLLIHVLLIFYPGIRENLFDAKLYIRGARFLLLRGEFEDAHHIFYAVPILTIAFFIRLFREHGILAFVVFQCMLSGLATIALYKSAAKLFNDHLGGLVTGVIFLCWWDMIQWNTAVMTESIACSLICFVIFFLVRFKGSLREYITLTGVLLMLFFTRPTSVVIILGCLFFFLASHRQALQRHRGKSFILFAFLSLLACYCAMLMFSHWDFTDQYVRGNIITYMDTIEGQPLYHGALRIDTEGVVVPDPDRTPIIKIVLFIVNNPIHFIKAAGLKVFYLVSGVRPYFSFSHNLYSASWHAMIYVFFYFGYRKVIQQPIKNFVVAVIVINCLLVGASTIDWDNRFYIIMQPAIVLLAGGGCMSLLKSFRFVNKSGQE